ncbi:hypothetical protein RaK2_00481 [Klebsiella phage vB_KleM_RaK2]|uniref:Uncharacterized protein n=1 Tax=Klebsiella phage vB_KleM_RaK2 TaxID=1147094 RepID=H6X4T8_9CAUD|nr:hypothetical protein F403_gp054 [Klebsiella phage vB_KleM_RaK2]AFA44754.1 hypothetical protein RaK2_00481 [Klebsiella phage vB_KleM_RaK2]
MRLLNLLQKKIIRIQYQLLNKREHNKRKKHVLLKRNQVLLLVQLNKQKQLKLLLMIPVLKIHQTTMIVLIVLQSYLV